MFPDHIFYKLSILHHCQLLHILNTINKHSSPAFRMTQPRPKSTTTTTSSTQGPTLTPVTIIHPTIPPASYDIGRPSPPLELLPNTFLAQTPEIRITTSELSQVKIFLWAIFGIFVALAIVISVWDWLDSRNVSTSV
jgi:hypothetical protein